MLQKGGGARADVRLATGQAIRLGDKNETGASLQVAQHSTGDRLLGHLRPSSGWDLGCEAASEATKRDFAGPHVANVRARDDKSMASFQFTACAAALTHLGLKKRLMRAARPTRV